MKNEIVKNNTIDIHGNLFYQNDKGFFINHFRVSETKYKYHLIDAGLIKDDYISPYSK